MSLSTSLKKALILSALLVASLSAEAQSRMTFLSSQDLKISSFPPPPQEGSVADQEDLRYVLDLQRTRSKEQCARAMGEVSLGLNAIFGPVNGPLTRSEVAQVQGLYQSLFMDTDYFVNSIKSKWKRQRPFQRSTEVRPCIPPHNSSSYPSGHAAISRMAALALGEVFPEKAEMLLKRADEVAMDRVLGGVHHLADIQAGQKLADALYAQLIQKNQFQKTIQNIKASGAKGK